MTKLNMFKVVPAAILAMIVLVIAYTSMQSMRANAWYFNALNIVQESDGALSGSSLQAAENAITLATNMDPDHPHYWHFLAHIKMLGLTGIDTTSSEQSDKVKQTYQQAEQALLKSVELRQTWALTWISLAQVVSYQKGPTKRVYDYIQQAKKVGPYKLDVHLGIIQIALMHWNELPPTYKALYVKELKLASKYGYKFNNIFSMAKEMNRLPIVCLSLQFGSHYEAIRGSWMFNKYCG
ncbi:VpsP family polysaccharide biosynthesis protein [Pseudoalteromonas tetraodonis]|uniref:VpsP family polysaccharide biosynthesis protein n=1 Tax=Pseudoalteromonas tetraodonis TaxID=43659 RepID=UPI003CFD1C5A